MKVNHNLRIENARIIFRNFRGEEKKTTDGRTVNARGKRNFCVLIDSKSAQDLIGEGWNVKFLTPRDEGEEPTPYIQVSVSYENEALMPKIFLVTGHGKPTLLDEETINSLDYAEIDNIDIIIRPYNWEVKTKSGVETGVKGYVKTMYVSIVEDDFADKYFVPDDME